MRNHSLALNLLIVFNINYSPNPLFFLYSMNIVGPLVYINDKHVKLLIKHCENNLFQFLLFRVFLSYYVKIGRTFTFS
jgi:hypothetical protein